VPGSMAARRGEQMTKDLKPVDTEAAAQARFAETWGAQYPAIIALWRSRGLQFVHFLDDDVEIRKVICSTNAIERRGPAHTPVSRTDTR
jgi:putative transposase